jgi:hypothetical protein
MASPCGGTSTVSDPPYSANLPMSPKREKDADFPAASTTIFLVVDCESPVTLPTNRANANNTGRMFDRPRRRDILSITLRATLRT